MQLGERPVVQKQPDCALSGKFNQQESIQKSQAVAKSRESNSKCKNPFLLHHSLNILSVVTLKMLIKGRFPSEYLIFPSMFRGENSGYIPMIFGGSLETLLGQVNLLKIN